MVFPIEAFAPKCFQPFYLILLHCPKINCYKDFTVTLGFFSSMGVYIQIYSKKLGMEYIDPYVHPNF